MIAMNRILCPVDFSEYSRRAFDQALGVARCYGSTVTALHVISPVPAVVAAPPYVGTVTPPIVDPTSDRIALAAQVQRLVESERVPGVPVNVLLEEAPSVHDEILVQANLLHADLVVMGTHGRSGFERLFLGSTAEKVLRKARCPVMTVPPGAPDAMPRGPAPFKRVLCAVDFSASSAVVMQYGVSLAQESRGSLTLMHAIEALPLYYDFTPPAVVDLDAWSAAARRRLGELVPESTRASCSITHVVRLGKPYRQILELAAEARADLIVMGIQGRGAADLFFFGSTTHHVLREAKCAVLTLRG